MQIPNTSRQFDQSRTQLLATLPNFEKEPSWKPIRDASAEDREDFFLAGCWVYGKAESGDVQRAKGILTRSRDQRRCATRQLRDSERECEISAYLQSGIPVYGLFLPWATLKLAEKVLVLVPVHATVTAGNLCHSTEQGSTKPQPPEQTANGSRGTHSARPFNSGRLDDIQVSRAKNLPRHKRG
ncbi:hypothetical protein MKZ38_009344 [Zalerion maritima]|uniref:Uncharacterized protein n=1 Tax=Zalerion maritima TaxID=339359 RepID=A0AAD5RTD3_9PEZI|nr:hypothetical protein MKZ38_009344 [Zalerion maritima]